jgi:UDP-N-acetylmuramate dehydrogenase
MEIKKLSLKSLTSFRIGGIANVVIVKSEEELLEAVEYAKSKILIIHILGEGTNSVFGENLERFLIIKNEIMGKSLVVSRQPLEGTETIESLTPSAYSLTAGSGESWDDIVKLSVEKNLWGIENLSYIPGTVGASPVQNIGAYGTELKDTLVSVRAFDIQKNNFVTLTNEECKFGYRDSIFKHKIKRYIITAITLNLSVTAKPILTYKPLDSLLNQDPTSPEGFAGHGNLTPKDVRELVIKTRTQKLPDYNLYPNAGSFFKNPTVGNLQGLALQEKYPDIPMIKLEDGYKIPSAWLIEHIAKMKGDRIGNIGTWPTQPLVLVNYGGATLEELEEFSLMIIEKIKNEIGVTLEREVNFIGF